MTVKDQLNLMDAPLDTSLAELGRRLDAVERSIQQQNELLAAIKDQIGPFLTAVSNSRLIQMLGIKL